MLEREKPDGVVVCVHADFHARVAIEAMEAGFHVYTEKPPALDLAQCREVLATQRRTGRVCMCAFKKRFAPAYIRDYSLTLSPRACGRQPRAAVLDLARSQLFRPSA